MIAFPGVFRTMMLLAALAACGYMLTTSLVSRRIDPAPARRLDLLEALFSALALAICVAGFIGIVLVEIGWFSLWSVVFALFTIAGRGRPPGGEAWSASLARRRCLQVRMAGIGAALASLLRALFTTPRIHHRRRGRRRLCEYRRQYRADRRTLHS